MKLKQGKPSSQHDLYFIWKAMLSRCDNPTNPGYKDYGERGITVCARWYELECFAADMGPRKLTDTLDRLDNDAGYGPENCRWVSQLEQMKAGRGQRRLTNHSGVPGVAARGKKWEAYVTVNYKRIHLYCGASFEAAVNARKTWEANNA